MNFPDGMTASAVRERFRNWTRDEFDTSVLTRSLASAVMLFILQSILVISFAALIFKGPLSDGLSLGLTFFLAGNMFLVLLVSLFSSYPGSIAVQQDTPAVIMALAVAGIAGALPAQAQVGESFATALFLILITTSIAGFTFLAIGVFGLGGLVRFLPYPVMGGFLAGTGWLLVMGGIGVMHPITSPEALVLPENLYLWLPGFLAGISILAARRRWPGPLTLVAGTLLLFAAFYLAVLLFRVPIDFLSAGGWLLGPFPEKAYWSFPLTSGYPAEVNWPALFSALPGAIPAVLIGTIALLLNATGLELIIKKDMDINRELVAAGAANLVSALTGGLIGYQAISLSTLNHNLTRGRRMPGLLSALLLLMTLLFGTQLLSFVPRMVLGALLVYLGADLVYEWVIDVWKKFPRVDALIVMAILVTIVLKDFLWGIGVGMVLTIIMFVVSYSRVNVVRYTASGNYFRSRHNRQIEHERVLQLHGDKLYVLRLEGFIFFGTANHLYERVKVLLHPGPDLPIEYILLDFSLVNGFDTTGLLSFEKMLQAARDGNTTLIFSGLTGRGYEQFQKGGFLKETDGLLIFPNLDRAIEWCETQLIMTHSSEISRDKSLLKHFEHQLAGNEALPHLMDYLVRRKFSAGDFLMRIGDPPDELLFVESGQVTVQLHSDSETPVRLETTGGGRVIGELGFFLLQPRTADVVADTDTVACILTQEALARMKLNHPDALHALSQIVIFQTSQRVVTMTRALDVLRN